MMTKKELNLHKAGITFSKDEFYSRAVEILSQFLPVKLTQAEKKVVVEYLKAGYLNVLSTESKGEVREALGLTLHSINSYNYRLKKKGVLVLKEGIWYLKPLLRIDPTVKVLNINVTMSL